MKKDPLLTPSPPPPPILSPPNEGWGCVCVCGNMCVPRGRKEGSTTRECAPAFLSSFDTVGLLSGFKQGKMSVKVMAPAL